MYEITNEIESALKTTPKQRWENNRDAIATLNELSSSGRTPTPDELNKLALFNGWGAIPTIFDLNPTGWSKQAQLELQVLLGQEKYALAAESILNAHYTDCLIVRAIWDKLKSIGFNGGRILEPSCGTGFFFGCMPKEIQNNSQLFGVELDKTAAAMASYLYPKSTIYDRGFETVEFPDGYFDWERRATVSSGKNK